MSFTTMQLLAGYVVYYLNPVIFLLALLKLVNIQYYTIYGDKELISPILRKLTPTVQTLYTKNINGRVVSDGYFWGRHACGYINIVPGGEDVIHIVTFTSFYNELIQEAEQPKSMVEYKMEKQCNKISVYMRKGTYKNFYYHRLTLDISHITPIGQQKEVLDNIVSIYNKLGRATVFLHGVSCAGKSTIGYLLAKQMSGIYCHTFNPSDPGDHLSSLILDIARDTEPLIVVLEETDEIIRKIHHGTIEQNVEIPTLVHNKSTWSTFLDDMVFYKSVILILTSNTSKQEIDDLDESYLRKGRIHASYSMMTPLVFHELSEEISTDQTELTSS